MRDKGNLSLNHHNDIFPGILNHRRIEGKLNLGFWRLTSGQYPEWTWVIDRNVAMSRTPTPPTGGKGNVLSWSEHRCWLRRNRQPQLPPSCDHCLRLFPYKDPLSRFTNPTPHSNKYNKFCELPSRCRCRCCCCYCCVSIRVQGPEPKFAVHGSVMSPSLSPQLVSLKALQVTAEKVLKRISNRNSSLLSTPLLKSLY